MINYLFSGIDKEKGFTQEQSRLLKEDIILDSTITLIASIFNNYERNDKQLICYTKLFSEIGIKFKEINLIDNRQIPQQAKKIIQNSDVIFLLGGSPELQMKSIKEYQIIEEIKQGKIIIGVSAGSMNQSNRVMYKDDFDNFIMKDYQGLGVVNINIFPHYQSTMLEESKEISNKLPLILLPKDSFIRIKDNKIEIIGESYNLYKGILKNNID